MDKNKADQRPNGSAKNKGGGNVPPFKNDGAVSVFVFCTTAFAILSAVFGNFHQIWFKWVVVPLAIIAALVWIYRKVKSKSYLWPLTILCALASVVLFITAYRVFPPPTEKKPEFKFSFQTGELPSEIELTNDFLKISKFMVEDGGRIGDVGGFLVVPFSPNKTNVALKFCVINKSHVTAESVQVAVSVPKEWKCVPGTGWEVWENKSTYKRRHISTPDEPVEIESWVYPAKHALLAGNGEYLPPLRVTAIPEPERFDAMSLIARAKDSESFGFRFEVIFFPSNQLVDITKPTVILGTNTPSGLSIPLRYREFK